MGGGLRLGRHSGRLETGQCCRQLASIQLRSSRSVPKASDVLSSGFLSKTTVLTIS